MARLFTLRNLSCTYQTGGREGRPASVARARQASAPWPFCVSTAAMASDALVESVPVSTLASAASRGRRCVLASAPPASSNGLPISPSVKVPCACWAARSQLGLPVLVSALSEGTNSRCQLSPASASDFPLASVSQGLTESRPAARSTAATSAATSSSMPEPTSSSASCGSVMAAAASAASVAAASAAAAWNLASDFSKMSPPGPCLRCDT